MAEQVRKFTKGDVQVSVFAELFKADGTPLDLTAIAGATVKFRMVSNADGSVKVNNQVAAAVSNGGATTPAQVRYDWATADVDTVGEYWAWFIVTDSGNKTQHFPTGRGFQIKIVDEK